MYMYAFVWVGMNVCLITCPYGHVQHLLHFPLGYLLVRGRKNDNTPIVSFILRGQPCTCIVEVDTVFIHERSCCIAGAEGVISDAWVVTNIL